MLAVRLYGLDRGYGSYAQVLRGIEHAFRLHGYGPERLVRVGIEERSEEEELGLATAEVGVFLGPPIACSALQQHAQHRVRCVMVGPNSDRLPEPTMRMVNTHATHIIVPSEWAASIVHRFTQRPVIVVPHGVSPGFQPQSAPGLERAYEEGEFRVLHLSSSTRQRKCTLELIQAWRRLRKQRALPPTSRLWLIVPAETRARLIEWCADEGETLESLGLLIGPRLGLGQEGAAPEELARVFAGVHAVCQPSRGEAFGLVPLEALATGVPIIATNSTGHSQWFTAGLDGAVPVMTQGMGPIDDLPGAQAPRVFVTDIADAIEWTYENWHKVKAAALVHAQAIRLEWSWERQTEAFIRWLEGECQ
ncbi:MAG TPA: glycosyltransferase family 4 protein [Candidatus Krumholzibacteria bacterium]